MNKKQSLDDLTRKKQILHRCKAHVPDGASAFARALGIGCGEGWIIKDLPATEINGIELAAIHTPHLPENVTRVYKPEGKYDLIVATGVVQSGYWNLNQIFNWIKGCATGIVVTCGVTKHEVPLPFFTEKYMFEFPYDGDHSSQTLRVYDALPF